MKTYVITLSQVFPATHPRKGEKTEFKEKVLAAINEPYQSAIRPKIHTIRANYEFWKKRFDDIYAGTACLSIRQWTGKPYCSKQVEIARLTKDDGIGIQKLIFYHGSIEYPIIRGGCEPLLSELAYNDGLSVEDWSAWFKRYNLYMPLAIIHFTSMRY